MPAATEMDECFKLKIRDALDKVLSSDDFVRSKRTSSFLRYVVEETLAGRSEQLKAFTVAVDVYGRDVSFDPRTDTIVRVEAGRMRRRLTHYYANAGSQDPVCIELPKGGYSPIFIARREVESDVDGEPVEILRGESQDIRGQRLSSTVAIGIILVLVAVSVSLTVWWFAPWQKQEAVLGTPKIAIMEFLNTSGEPKYDYLSRGFTAELGVATAHFPNMVVVSRVSSTVYSDVGTDVMDIGAHLSAQYVLRGSLWTDGMLLKITAELVDTKSAEIIWAEIYTKSVAAETSFKTSIAIADNIARAVAKPYGAVFRDVKRALDKDSKTQFSSYRCILQAYDYGLVRSVDAHRATRTCLEHVVESEPNHATAWGQLSGLYLDEFRSGYNPRINYNPLDLALDAARRAVQLAPENSNSHRTLAVVHYFRKEISNFIESNERALTLGANNADVVADYGFKLSISGHWKRGLMLLERAMQMSPVHPPSWHFPFVLDAYRRGAYDDARLLSNKISMPDFYMTHVFRAMVYGQLGKIVEAHDALQELSRLKPNYAENVRRDFLRRNLPAPLVEHIVGGLSKAGLDIPAER